MAQKTRQKDNTTYVVTDEKGEVYRVTTNIIGQKVRKAFGGGRVVVWLIVVLGGGNYIRQHVEGWMMFALIALLLIVGYQLICKVIVSEEELKTMRPLVKGEKVN